MDKTVPPGAARLLDFIGTIEAGKSGYEAVYGHNQNKLPKPLTQMTIGEVLAAGPIWSQRFGSSACGRYQFMAGNNHTLAGLDRELGLRNSQIFDPNLQDRLGYHLLLRRGYAKWVKGVLTTVAFAKALAQEWASMPVLASTQGAHRKVSRGQSYYAGDGLNKSLVSPERFEVVLEAALMLGRNMPVPAVIADTKAKEVGAKNAAAGATVTAAGTGAGSIATSGAAVNTVQVADFDWSAWLAVGTLAAIVALVIFILIRYALRQKRLVDAYKLELAYHG